MRVLRDYPLHGVYAGDIGTVRRVDPDAYLVRFRVEDGWQDLSVPQAHVRVL